MKRAALFFAVLVCLAFSVTLALADSGKDIGGKDLTFNPKGAKPVIFSHQLHVSSKGLKCTGCHFHIFQMSKGSYKMDMKKITKGEFCGNCHNGRKSFGVKESKNCTRCHK